MQSPQQTKVFCFFFSKKNALSFLKKSGSQVATARIKKLLSVKKGRG